MGNQEENNTRYEKGLPPVLWVFGLVLFVGISVWVFTG